MAHTDDIFQCPVTGRSLRRQGDMYVADGEDRGYRVFDDIAMLLPAAREATTSSNIIGWYDSFGWEQDPNGGFKETSAASGARAVQTEHTGHCISRLSKYFDRGGDYIVDVGSGPIAHSELLSYGQHFEKRICIDLSVTGLRQAKQKLGDKGIYVQADATKLPLSSGSVDAITCNHVIYQLPVELQRPAILELWRVLKPGGVAVIVYRWQHSGVSLKLEKLAAKLGLGDQRSSKDSEPEQVPEREPDEPQSRQWFEEQDWPFEYTYDCYRMVDNAFMRRYVRDDWRGRLFLNTLLTMQRCLPSQCGRYGMFPAIIIRKPTLN
jgi:ubiquinone/menaquinone biosynthesis C-methylase UbiE